MKLQFSGRMAEKNPNPRKWAAVIARKIPQQNERMPPDGNTPLCKEGHVNLRMEKA